MCMYLYRTCEDADHVILVILKAEKGTYTDLRGGRRGEPSSPLNFLNEFLSLSIQPYFVEYKSKRGFEMYPLFSTFMVLFTSHILWISIVKI